ncbi:hypothetical protein PIB30_019483 [Stylosanthes scabra]|uniref:Uncharacterized protein n=1 Tax=Stylosanthes scabra TaxID=79078 RepID=A0ABU6TAC3_9FABA|nr:hypothetical protein [Stylosanthes scabra]
MKLLISSRGVHGSDPIRIFEVKNRIRPEYLRIRSDLDPHIDKPPDKLQARLDNRPDLVLIKKPIPNYGGSFDLLEAAHGFDSHKRRMDSIPTLVEKPKPSTPFSSVPFLVFAVTSFRSNHHPSLFLTLFPFNHRRRSHSRRFSAVRSPPWSAPSHEKPCFSTKESVLKDFHERKALSRTVFRLNSG